MFLARIRDPQKLIVTTVTVTCSALYQATECHTRLLTHASSTRPPRAIQSSL